MIGVVATLAITGHRDGGSDNPRVDHNQQRRGEQVARDRSREDRLKQLAIPREGIGELKAQVDDLVGSIASLEDARALMASAEGLVADQSARMALGMLIIERAATIGPPEEVWKMIHASPGQARNMQIQGFFRASNLTADQVKGFVKDMFPDERNAAVAGRISSLVQLNNLRDFSLDGFDSLDEKQRRYLLLKLQMLGDGNVGGVTALDRGETPKRSLEALEAAETFFNRKIFEWDELCDYVSKARDGSNANDKWRLLKELSEKHGVLISAAAKRQVVAEMVRSAPEKTLANLISDSSLPALDSVATAVSVWLDVDANKPAEYYHKHSENWNAEQRSKFAMALVEYSLQWKDTKTAALWLEEVSDSKIREEASARINERAK